MIESISALSFAHAVFEIKPLEAQNKIAENVLKMVNITFIHFRSLT